jgi:hypothetical protein
LRHCGFCLAPDHRERRADRNRLAFGNDYALDETVFEDLYLDCGFVSIDQRYYVSALDLVAGLDAPFEELARIHVSAEGRHAKLSHHLSPCFVPPR